MAAALSLLLAASGNGAYGGETDRRAAALFYGTAESGVTAEVAGGIAVPTRGFACANCHGGDGAGGAEGALVVPPIAHADAPLDAEDLMLALTERRGRDGRALSRVMPHYDIRPDLATALARFLANLPANETRGVAADTVHFIVPADARTLPLAEDFRDGIAAALGSRAFWGRRVTVAVSTMEAVDGGEAFAAVGAALSQPADRARLAGSGLPVLAPLGPIEESADPFVRLLCASHGAQVEALLGIVPRDAAMALVAERSERTALATRLSGEGRKLAASPTGHDTLLLSNAPAAVRAVAGSARVLGLAEQLGPTVAPLLLTHGVSLVLADGCARPLAAATADGPRSERLGRATGLAVAEALAASGRTLTRARFLDALDALDPPALTREGAAPILITLDAEPRK